MRILWLVAAVVLGAAAVVGIGLLFASETAARGQRFSSPYYSPRPSPLPAGFDPVPHFDGPEAEFEYRGAQCDAAKARYTLVADCH